MRRKERIVCDYLGFTPGPLSKSEKMYTWEAKDLEEYSYEAVAQAILSHPGMRQTHPPEPAWQHFAALWRHADRRLGLDFMPDTEQFGWETGQPRWTGCDLKCDCLVGDLIDLWKSIRKKCPQVWLYDGGAFEAEAGSLILSPRGFLRMPTLA
jgi:hypothetical protein